MHAHEELLGADFYEHDIRHPSVGVSRYVIFSLITHYEFWYEAIISSVARHFSNLNRYLGTNRYLDAVATLVIGSLGTKNVTVGITGKI